MQCFQMDCSSGLQMMTAKVVCSLIPTLWLHTFHLPAKQNNEEQKVENGLHYLWTVLCLSAFVVSTTLAFVSAKTAKLAYLSANYFKDWQCFCLQGIAKSFMGITAVWNSAANLLHPSAHKQKLQIATTNCNDSEQILHM